MRHDLAIADIANLLGRSETKAADLLRGPTKKREKPKPLPDRFAYEESYSITSVGGCHAVMRKQTVAADRKVLFSGSTSVGLFDSTEDAQKAVRAFGA
jgi:hypothetical protein